MSNARNRSGWCGGKVGHKFRVALFINTPIYTILSTGSPAMTTTSSDVDQCALLKSARVIAQVAYIIRISKTTSVPLAPKPVHSIAVHNIYRFSVFCRQQHCAQRRNSRLKERAAT